MNKAQYIDIQMEKYYGLHPFDRLCHDCPLADCVPSNHNCLQRKVNNDMEAKGVLGWIKKTRLMMDAGLRPQLGEIPIVLGLEEEKRGQGRCERTARRKAELDKGLERISKGDRSHRKSEAIDYEAKFSHYICHL